MRAQAAISSEAPAPPYSGISLERSQPAIDGWVPNRRLISPANQACCETSQTSR